MADNQNPNGVAVQRYFEYKDDSILMHSRYEGDFGPIMLMSFVRIYEHEGSLSIHQEVVSNSDGDFCPLEFRVGEMNYLLSISLLFNPKNKTEYGIPKESQTSDL